MRGPSSSDEVSTRRIAGLAGDETAEREGDGCTSSGEKLPGARCGGWVDILRGVDRDDLQCSGVAVEERQIRQKNSPQLHLRK